MKCLSTIVFYSFFILKIQCHLAFEVNNMTDSEKPMDHDKSCNTRDFILVSTIDGMVTALDMKTGKKCWSVLLDAETFFSSTLSELEVFENGKQIWLVPSLDGSLFKYDHYNIHPLPVDVDSLISHSTYLDASTNIIGGKIKAIFGIHRLTGEIIYMCKIDGCNSLKTPFPENILIVEEIVQSVNAIDSNEAKIKWHFRVVELNIRLASQRSSESSSEFYSNIEDKALITTSFNEYINLDTYKVSLLNGFAGMMNKSSKNFSWLFKPPCPINDVWFVKDNGVKMLDPFDNDSGFFSIEMDDGRYSALLFLGTYQNQMFIKKSKKFPRKNKSFSSLSTHVLHYSTSFPVCPKAENVVTVNNPESKDIVPANMYLNVSEYGSYFYINFSIAENMTHCIINTSYIIQYDKKVDLSYWVGVYITIVFGAIVVPVFIAVFKTLNEKKQYANASTSSFELTVPKLKEIADNVCVQEFRSRFYQDFELIAILGKGGFGVVMDVKNKIDDCRYAVKRIRIHEKFNSSQYEKLLREVKALAKLDHHGIVRYFNAWIEHPPVGWQEEKDMQANICDISEANVSSSHSSDGESRLSCKQDVSSSLSKVLHKLKQNPLGLNDSFSFYENSVPNNDCQFSDYSTSDDSRDSSSSSVTKWQKTTPHYSSQVVKHDPKNSSSENSKSSEKMLINSKLASRKFLDEDKNSNNTSSSSSIRFIENEQSREWSEKREINSVFQSNQDNYRKLNCKNDDLQTELYEEHAECCNILKKLNHSLIKPFDSGRFNSFCTFFFHDMAVYSKSVIEKSDWRKIADTTSKKELIYFQEWLICMLCMMRSFNFGCDLEIGNFCDILYDVTKRLNKGHYIKNGYLLNSELEPLKYSVHFSLGSDKPDTAEESTGLSSDKKVSKKNATSFTEESHLKVTPGYLYIQMQLCQKESLRDWLNKNSAYREYKKVMEIFYEIVDAVYYVHDCGLMHRDLKPSNIYFSLEGAIKVGDFGLATSSEIHEEKAEGTKEFTEVHTSDIGTELYMSPEQRLKEDYDCKTDIYSLGIILFELLVPFRTYSERYEVLSKVRCLKFPKAFERSYQNESQLVRKMLKTDPKSRPSTDEIKRHPLFLQFSSK